MEGQLLRHLFKDIPGSDTWHSVEPVEKGWSEDKKYHIITDVGEHLLLRVSNLETYDAKKREFEMIQTLSHLDFEMSKAYAFGVCQEGVYSLLGWIKGRDMEAVLPNLSFIKQYELGIEAGRILKKIHTVPMSIEPYCWAEKFNRKLDRKIENYKQCPLKYEQGEVFIDYIERSRDLLENRPICLHHGDYHVGNIILSESGHIGVIDFNRFDYGDPWEEFNRIVWDIQVSSAFATGRVDGYFDNEIPVDFFSLLALYIASNTLSSLPWAIPFGEGEIETMKNQARYILEDFESFKITIPKWYAQTKQKIEKLQLDPEA